MGNKQIVYRTPELEYVDMYFYSEIRERLLKFLELLNKELVAQGMKAVLVDTVGFIEVRKDDAPHEERKNNECRDKQV